MALFQDIVLSDSIEIRTTPEKVFNFLTSLVDAESYLAWHPEDHVVFQWIKGEPWQQGSVAYAEEYIHGKLHKFKFLIKEVVPNRKIEMVPVSRILRIFFPRNTFLIEPLGDSCLFTASGLLRVGFLVKLLAKHRLEQGISSVRQHMKEEGENLKRILEKRESCNQTVEEAS